MSSPSSALSLFRSSALALPQSPPDLELSAALDEFRNSLKPEDRAVLQANTTTPNSESVLKLTIELNEARSKHATRCIAGRLSRLLDSVQQFSSIIGTYVSSNPAVAALIWGSLRFTLLVFHLLTLLTTCIMLPANPSFTVRHSRSLVF